MKIAKELYWDTLVDHYYDNVHWDLEISPYPAAGSIQLWLKEKYGAVVCNDTANICFDSTDKLSWFLLRWS